MPEVMQVGDRLDRVISSIGLGSALDRRDDAGSEVTLSRKERVFVAVSHMVVAVGAVQAFHGDLLAAGALVFVYAALFVFGTWKRRQGR
jgi:hypothetical protein